MDRAEIFTSALVNYLINICLIKTLFISTRKLLTHDSLHYSSANNSAQIWSTS